MSLLVIETGPKVIVPVQLLSLPPFLTKTAFPEVVLKLQVPFIVIPPLDINAAAPVKFPFVMETSPVLVVTEKSPRSVARVVLKVVGLKEPLVEDED